MGSEQALPVKEGVCVAPSFPALSSGPWGVCVLNPEPQMKPLQVTACVARSLVFFPSFPDVYAWSHPTRGILSCF